MDQRELTTKVQALTKAIAQSEPAESVISLMNTLKNASAPSEEHLRVSRANLRVTGRSVGCLAIPPRQNRRHSCPSPRTRARTHARSYLCPLPALARLSRLTRTCTAHQGRPRSGQAPIPRQLGHQAAGGRDRQQVEEGGRDGEEGKAAARQDVVARRHPSGPQLPRRSA